MKNVNSKFSITVTAFKVIFDNLTTHHVQTLILIHLVQKTLRPVRLTYKKNYIFSISTHNITDMRYYVRFLSNFIKKKLF